MGNICSFIFLHTFPPGVCRGWAASRGVELEFQGVCSGGWRAAKGSEEPVMSEDPAAKGQTHSSIKVNMGRNWVSPNQRTPSFQNRIAVSWNGQEAAALETAHGVFLFSRWKTKQPDWL